MKIFYLLPLLIMGACSYTYTVENEIVDCLNTKAKESNIDLHNDFLRCENFLITNGFLEDNSGDSYYQVYEGIANGGGIVGTPLMNIPDSLMSRLSIDLSCGCLSNGKQIEGYERSKIAHINQKIDSLQLLDDIKIDMVFQKFTEVLTPKDYENNFYKMVTLGYVNCAVSSNQD